MPPAPRRMAPGSRIFARYRSLVRDTNSSCPGRVQRALLRERNETRDPAQKVRSTLLDRAGGVASKRGTLSLLRQIGRLGQVFVRVVDVDIRLRLQFRELLQQILRLDPVLARRPADRLALG